MSMHKHIHKIWLFSLGFDMVFDSFDYDHTHYIFDKIITNYISTNYEMKNFNKITKLIFSEHKMEYNSNKNNPNWL